MYRMVFINRWWTHVDLISSTTTTSSSSSSSSSSQTTIHVLTLPTCFFLVSSWSLSSLYVAKTASHPWCQVRQKLVALSGETKRCVNRWNTGGSYMGVSKNSGTPKWMVYNGKPMKTLLRWMIWGYLYFRKHPCGGLSANLASTNIYSESQCFFS